MAETEKTAPAPRARKPRRPCLECFPHGMPAGAHTASCVHYRFVDEKKAAEVPAGQPEVDIDDGSDDDEPEE